MQIERHESRSTPNDLTTYIPIHSYIQMEQKSEVLMVYQTTFANTLCLVHRLVS